jgi:hypothetical protein
MRLDMWRFAAIFIIIWAAAAQTSAAASRATTIRKLDQDDFLSATISNPIPPSNFETTLNIAPFEDS